MNKSVETLMGKYKDSEWGKLKGEFLGYLQDIYTEMSKVKDIKTHIEVLSIVCEMSSHFKKKNRKGLIEMEKKLKKII